MIRADKARQDGIEQRRLAEANECKAKDAAAAERTATAEADTQRKKAELEKQIALAVKDFLQNKLLAQADLKIQHLALMKLGRLQPDERTKRNPTVRELLDRAARELSEASIEANFSGRPLLQAELLLTVGRAYI